MIIQIMKLVLLDGELMRLMENIGLGEIVMEHNGEN